MDGLTVKQKPVGGLPPVGDFQLGNLPADSRAALGRAGRSSVAAQARPSLVGARALTQVALCWSCDVLLVGPWPYRLVGYASTGAAVYDSGVRRLE